MSPLSLTKHTKHFSSQHHLFIDIQFVESDNNAGSTDSEVRKILTLHIPITEYDTLGSESDNELQARSVNQASYRANSQRGEFLSFSPFSFIVTFEDPQIR